MNRIQAILTLDMENIPSNFQEIIQHEKEVVAKWKSEGILEHLFLRQGNGAVLIFKDVDEIKADYIKGLTIHYVDTMKEVIDLALTKEKVLDPIKLVIPTKS